MKNNRFFNIMFSTLVLGSLGFININGFSKIQTTNINSKTNLLHFTFRPAIQWLEHEFQGIYQVKGYPYIYDFVLTDSIDYLTVEEEPGTHTSTFEDNLLIVEYGYWSGRHYGPGCYRADRYDISQEIGIDNYDKTSTFRQMSFIGEGWCAPNQPTYYDSQFNYIYLGYEDNKISYQFSLDYYKDRGEGGYSFPHEEFINGTFDPEGTGSALKINNWGSSVVFEGYYKEGYIFDWSKAIIDENYMFNLIKNNLLNFNLNSMTYNELEGILLNSYVPIYNYEEELMGFPTLGTSIEFKISSGIVDDKSKTINFNDVEYRFVSNKKSNLVVGKSSWNKFIL